MSSIKTEKSIILIVIDVPLRDVKACTMVGYQLLKNHDCQLIFTTTKNEIASLLYYRPDVIVVSHLQYDRLLDVAEFAHKIGTRICILPTEGLLVFDEAAPFLYGSEESLPYIDLFLCWGEKVASELKKHIPEANINVIGCVRFDTYAPEFQSLYATREDFFQKYGFDLNKPLVVWFSSGGYQTGDIDEQVERLRLKNRLAQIDMPKERIMDQRAVKQICEDYLSRYIQEHADEFNFAFRSHPLEAKSVYEDFLTNNPTVINFNSDEPIDEAILYTDVQVGYPCTVSLESWVQKIDRTTIFIRSDEIRMTEMRKLDLSCGTIVSSYSELENTMNQFASKSDSNQELITQREKLIKEQAYRRDGKASERAADAIMELAKTTSQKPLPASLFFEVIKQRYKLLRRGTHLAMVRESSHPKYCDPEILKNWVDRLSQTIGRLDKEYTIAT
jgi:surface carbohydrate biosynthesis protein